MSSSGHKCVCHRLPHAATIGLAALCPRFAAILPASWVFLALALVLALTLPAQDDLSQKSQAIEDLLKSGKFEKAEPLVRECLRQLPHEIYFLGQLEMSLNGQGKRREADEVAAHIRQIWKSEYKERWIAKGAPVAESAWARIMTASRDYYVIGTEYFMPHLVEGDPKNKITSLWADYKVIALPKRADGGSRIFMLNKAASEKNYFLEEFTDKSIVMVAVYGKEKPDIRDLAKRVADYLDGGQAKGAE